LREIFGDDWGVNLLKVMYPAPFNISKYGIETDRQTDIAVGGVGAAEKQRASNVSVMSRTAKQQRQN